MKKIYIEITNSCNLNCEFCQNTGREKKFIKISDFEQIIKQVKKYTKLVCLHVKGEPLLYPDLKLILEIIDKNNLQVNITTNGILLNSKTEILLNSNSVRQINISLHSLVENKNIDISEYMEKIFESVDILKENIIISYRLWNMNTLENNENNEEIIKLLAEKYDIKNLNEVMKKNEWMKFENNVFLNQDTQFIWPNMNQNNIIEEGRCLAIKEQIGILVDGTVVPCCIDSEGEIKLGNIFEENLESILKSNRAKAIQKAFEQRIIKEDLCKKCGFLERLEKKRKKNNLA